MRSKNFTNLVFELISDYLLIRLSIALDFLHTQNRLLNDFNFKASDFEHKMKGMRTNKTHTFVFRHTDVDRNLSGAFMDLTKIDSDGILANDTEQLNKELNGILFGKKKMESSDLPGEDTVLSEWETRKLVAKVLRPKPTSDEEKDSERVQQKLDNVQKKTFDILRSVLGGQGEYYSNYCNLNSTN